jgi:hypothetical protein
VNWLLIGSVAAAALALIFALARAYGRGLERRLAAELGRRWEAHHAPPRPTDRPDASPVDRPGRTEAELHLTLQVLIEQRDTLLEELQIVQASIRRLTREAAQGRRLTAVEDGAEVITLHEPRDEPIERR